MTQDKTNSEEGPARLHGFVHDVLTLFVARINDHAAKGAGKLGPRDLTALAQTFTPETDHDLHDLCSSSWASFQHAFEEAFYAQMRKFPLERLMVAKFVHLLPERGEDPVPHRTLSRRVIPAFTQALQQMVGPELFDEYENRARNFIDSVRAKQGAAMDWEQLPNHPVAEILVNDILIYISRYFIDAQKRRHWMTSFFERTMPAAKTDAERAWQFGDLEFHKLMSSLYKTLAETLFDEDGRRHLEQRYDAASLSQLEQMLAGLAQDQRRVLAELNS